MIAGIVIGIAGFIGLIMTALNADFIQGEEKGTFLGKVDVLLLGTLCLCLMGVGVYLVVAEAGAMTTTGIIVGVIGIAGFIATPIIFADHIDKGTAFGAIGVALFLALFLALLAFGVYLVVAGAGAGIHC